ncbi:MAG: DUF1576 domain-containing protein [Oscillospiraceae bacterium]|nr:DUF1576 domain-containing protein [Oscillospiraceae bacterium]
MEKAAKFRIPIDYYKIMSICVLFLVIAFVMDTPYNIMKNLVVINTSRSVLVSDYIAMAGLSATLVNSAVSVLIFIGLLVINKCQPNGKIIAALFLTMGFSMFGKNIVNTLPLCFGVWLFAKVHKAKFSNYIMQAMFAATVSPLVSEIAFSGEESRIYRVVLAYLVGIFVGFIFPELMEAAKRMHRGYCLYNSGIAGGFIATFAVGLIKFTGAEIQPENYWSTEYTFLLAVAAYAISIAAILFGVIKDGPRKAFGKFFRIIKEHDHDNKDYLLLHGRASYINIGIMCIITTSTMLLLGFPINGPILGGILTVAGFAVAGKHVKNTIPVLIGSIMAAQLNFFDLTTPANALSILFSTGLAPIACKFGWIWGILAGFLHVSVAIFIGELNGGLNLYNNGFAGGFVAITLVPLIILSEKRFGKNNTEKEQ